MYFERGGEKARTSGGGAERIPDRPPPHPRSQRRTRHAEPDAGLETTNPGDRGGAAVGVQGAALPDVHVVSGSSAGAPCSEFHPETALAALWEEGAGTGPAAQLRRSATQTPSRRASGSSRPGFPAVVVA